MLTAEVAKYARCSEASVRRAASSGELKAYRPGGGRAPMKFKRQDVDRWMHSNPVDDDDWTWKPEPGEPPWGHQIKHLREDRSAPPRWDIDYGYPLTGAAIDMGAPWVDPVSGHVHYLKADLLAIARKFGAAYTAAIRDGETPEEAIATARESSPYDEMVVDNYGENGWE
jgi:excisionase family DNA binding protein